MFLYSKEGVCFGKYRLSVNFWFVNNDLVSEALIPESLMRFHRKLNKTWSFLHSSCSVAYKNFDSNDIIFLIKPFASSIELIYTL